MTLPTRVLGVKGSRLRPWRGADAPSLAPAMPGVARMLADVHADPVASMRALEERGDRCEGLLRRSARKAGVPADRAIYANDRG